MMSGRRISDYELPLVAPVELVKDQSVLKGRFMAAALVIGHPFYWWAWTFVDPQPYDDATWRAIASVLGLVALVAMLRWGAHDRRAAWSYGVACAFGTVVLASWFYVANGGNAVWLASLSVMTMLYFTVTDWRIAVVVTLVAWSASLLAVPMGVGVWSIQGGSYPLWNFTAWLVLGFTFIVSTLTRYTDMTMQGVRLRSQIKALGITAHEMRTPISGIQLLTSALRERLSEVKPGPIAEAQIEEIRDLANELERASQDAAALISAQLENANPYRPFSQRGRVSLAAAASDAITTFQRGSGSRQRLVTLNVVNDFEILADPPVVKQAIVNLLNNSLKAVVLRHRAAAAGLISITVDVGDGVGRVEVSDQGGGIPRDKLKLIFQPFYTGDPEHGHGLGLTFTRSVVESYGGSIKAALRSGGGTVITLSFPSAAIIQQRS